MIKKEKVTKDNVVKFPSKLTDLEKEIDGSMRHAFILGEEDMPKMIEGRGNFLQESTQKALNYFEEKIRTDPAIQSVLNQYIEKLESIESNGNISSLKARSGDIVAKIKIAKEI